MHLHSGNCAYLTCMQVIVWTNSLDIYTKTRFSGTMPYGAINQRFLFLPTITNRKHCYLQRTSAANSFIYIEDDPCHHSNNSMTKFIVWPPILMSEHTSSVSSFDLHKGDKWLVWISVCIQVVIIKSLFSHVPFELYFLMISLSLVYFYCLVSQLSVEKRAEHILSKQAGSEVLVQSLVATTGVWFKVLVHIWLHRLHKMFQKNFIILN